MSSSMETAQQDAARLPRLPQRKLDNIPGDYGTPLLGDTIPFLKDYHKLVTRRAEKYGLVSKGSVLFQRGVTLLGPEANEFVLKDPEHVFSSRAAWNPFLGSCCVISPTINSIAASCSRHSRSRHWPATWTA